MKIIELPRGAGKTTSLLRISSATKVPILYPASHAGRNNYLIQQARELGLSIPSPIPYDRNNGIYIRSYLVDDLDRFLMNGIGLDIVAATITSGQKVQIKISDVADRFGLKPDEIEIVP